MTNFSNLFDTFLVLGSVTHAVYPRFAEQKDLLKIASWVKNTGYLKNPRLVKGKIDPGTCGPRLGEVGIFLTRLANEKLLNAVRPKKRQKQHHFWSRETSEQVGPAGCQAFRRFLTGAAGRGGLKAFQLR